MKITISKAQWEKAGMDAGWMEKHAQAFTASTLPAQIEIVVGGNYPITANLVVMGQKYFLNPDDRNLKPLFDALNKNPELQQAVSGMGEWKKNLWEGIGKKINTPSGNPLAFMAPGKAQALSLE